MKNIAKKLSKNYFFQIFISYMIFFYIKFVNLTCKKIIEFDGDFSKDDFLNSEKKIFAIWHQNLGLCIIGLLDYSKKFSPLVSPHTDGMILANIIKKIGCNVISGSSNRNAFGAVKEILLYLKNNRNILITPDGPRGPSKRINSNIIAISEKSDSEIIPIKFEINKFFKLKSWDELKIPLPFCTIKINFGSSLPKGSNSEDLARLL